LGIFAEHPRITARMINRLLEFGGVFNEEEVDGLIKAAGTLAARAAANYQPMFYRAGMSVLLTAARMQMDLERRKAAQEQTDPVTGLPAPGGVNVSISTGAGGTPQIAIYIPDNGREPAPGGAEDALDGTIDGMDAQDEDAA
jgi:hypothetical protein